MNISSAPLQSSLEVTPIINPRLLSLDDSVWRQAALTLAAQLAETAVQRDREGGSAQLEKQLIRQSGCCG